MPRGGYRPGTGGRRPGAGRKKGSATQRTRKTNLLAQKAAREGPQPLQVMLDAMRDHYDKGELDAAAEIAKAAAPYCHPRLQSVQLETPPQGSGVQSVTAAVEETERALLQHVRDLARVAACGAVQGAVDAAKDSAPAPVVVEALPAGGAVEVGTP
jgi:hypothetical protein